MVSDRPWETGSGGVAIVVTCPNAEEVVVVEGD
jgi:hypothetical protein